MTNRRPSLVKAMSRTAAACPAGFITLPVACIRLIARWCAGHVHMAQRQQVRRGVPGRRLQRPGEAARRAEGRGSTGGEGARRAASYCPHHHERACGALVHSTPTHDRSPVPTAAVTARVHRSPPQSHRLAPLSLRATTAIVSCRYSSSSPPPLTMLSVLF